MGGELGATEQNVKRKTQGANQAHKGCGCCMNACHPVPNATQQNSAVHTAHLRGLSRMPSCWSRASGATPDGASGADMSMEARTAGGGRRESTKWAAVGPKNGSVASCSDNVVHSNAVHGNVAQAAM